MMASQAITKFCQKCQADTECEANGRCKPCAKTYNAAYRAANLEKLKAYDAERYATNPAREKANRAVRRAENPAKFKAAVAAYYAENTNKCKVVNAVYRVANLEQIKTAQAAYRAANPECGRINQHNRRARKRANGGVLSKGLAAKLFRWQNGKCACCGLPLGDDFHLDHITPIALGGPNSDDNIQLLRATCNLQKHAKHPVDFMQERGFLL